MTCATAPGKLLFFGEYAVLEGAEAVVAAVDRRARVCLAAADHFAFRSPQIGGQAIGFERDEHRVQWECGAEVRVRLALAEKLIEDLPATAPSMLAEADTGAFFEGVTKIGLGSSAALATAWTHCAHPDLDRAALFERALGVHRKFQGGRGSGVDVAASVHGGLLAYRRGAPDPVRSLPIPSSLHWRAVWTGRSADTRDFLRRLGTWQDAEPGRYDRAMNRLLEVSSAALAALEAEAADAIMACVRDSHAALSDLDRKAGIGIVSPVHAALADHAVSAGLCYKPSGAGGGDFGIVFGAAPDAFEGFASKAKTCGAALVPLAIDERGATLEADPQP